MFLSTYALRRKHTLFEYIYFIHTHSSNNNLDSQLQYRFLRNMKQETMNSVVPTSIQLGNLILNRISKGIDVNEPVTYDGHTETPLHCAVAHGNLHIVQLLLKHGADVCRKNGDGVSPLRVAHCPPETDNSYDIYKLLLKKGADFNDTGDFGLVLSPFLLALGCRSLKCIELLLDHGADITAVDSSGNSALHLAVRNNHIDVVKFVLDQGLGIDRKNVIDETALHVAAKMGKFEACQLLINRGAMVNLRVQWTGETPLTLAVGRALAKFEASKIIDLLLKSGADVEDKAGGRSVLEIAATDSASPGTRFVLMQHVAKMQHQYLPINEDDRQLIENKDCYKIYYNMCLRELETMRKEKFYNNVSVFTILMERKSTISGYDRNEELIIALEKQNSKYDTKFRIYFSWLKERFYTEVKRQRLQKIAAMNLSKLLKFNDQFGAVTGKILSHLSYAELKFLET